LVLSDPGFERNYSNFTTDLFREVGHAAQRDQPPGRCGGLRPPQKNLTSLGQISLVHSASTALDPADRRIRKAVKGFDGSDKMLFERILDLVVRDPA